MKVPDLISMLGWRALLIHGDPCVLDRWLWLRRHLRKGRFRTFDAGSGNGAFSFYAASVGNEVVAASFNNEEQNNARHRADELRLIVDFQLIDLRELASHKERLGKFDQIVCLETIEHLLDDEGLVRTLAAMLNPGGRLLLSAPSIDHHPLYTEEVHPSSEEDGSHVRYGYSHSRLRELLDEAGLTVKSEDNVSGVISQKVTSLMRLLKQHIGIRLAWVFTLPLRCLAFADPIATRLVHFPHLSVAIEGEARETTEASSRK